jgi:hypothetical protein
MVLGLRPLELTGGFWLFAISNACLALLNTSTVRIPRGLQSSLIASTNSSAILYAQVELGLYDHFTVVQQPTSLCLLNVMQLSMAADSTTDTDPSQCPHAGVYEWTAVYAVPVFADSTFHYTPDVRLTFLDHDGQRVGCIVTGPIALRAAADAKAVAGLIALGISVTVFMGIFAALLFLSHRRRQGLERLRLAGGNATGAAHPTGAMQYQYFRTLPNGQVVPVVGHPRPSLTSMPQLHSRVSASSTATTTRDGPVARPSRPMRSSAVQAPDDSDDDDDSENALNISNPAYNETQLPSRPII